MLKIIEFILNDYWLAYVFRCLISIGLGAFISFSLITSGQSWAKSFSNVTTYCILPLIGLVITSVISGNIALSLGMVGALSIIRFRHPVKSPLELSIYFLLLTVGITLTESIPKAFILTLFSMLIIYGYSYYIVKRAKLPGSFPALSFVREDPQYVLDVICSKQNIDLASSPYLLISNENKVKSIYTYKLAFGNKVEADKLKNEIDNIDSVSEMKYTCI